MFPSEESRVKEELMLDSEEEDESDFKDVYEGSKESGDIEDQKKELWLFNGSFYYKEDLGEASSSGLGSKVDRSDQEPYFCKKCKKRFRQENAFIYHKCEAEPKPIEDGQTAEGLNCRNCGVFCSNSTILTFHMKLKCPMKHECPSCDFTFSSKAYLDEHKNVCEKNKVKDVQEHIKTEIKLENVDKDCAGNLGECFW